MASKEQPILLSPLDQIMPRNHIRIALVFPTDNHSLAVSQLESGLARTCETLPFVKVRIFTNSSERDQLVISWNTSNSTPCLWEQPALDGYPSIWCSIYQD